ncbi:hypothetical protein KW785_00865 [Candidatus Parcubacteria bacterium]|nr:hypothetical protein [Candidatus Parcubacteria bacterium]
MQKINLERGQAMMVATVFFLVVSLTIIYGLVGPVLRQGQTVANLSLSRQSYFLAEAGVEDVIYRLATGKSVPASNTLTLNGSTATITTTTTATGKEVLSTGSVAGDVRKIKTNVVLGTGISFHYGIQAGQGGFRLYNSSSVTGNVYAEGPIIGDGGNYIYGEVVSAGPSGQIYGIHATGTAYAHFLGNAAQATIIDKSAYYQVKTNTTVSGTSYPNSSDQAVASLPIDDNQINAWESDAAAGGTMLSSQCDNYSSSTNTCTISSSRSIGPKKIPFNLLIKSASAVITVTGPLWVVGNITTQTQPTIQMDPSLGASNVAIIADDPSNRSTGSVVTVNQGTIFNNSGTVGSFVFMISQNNNAENGGSIDALTMNQGATALVGYAIHGQVSLSQSVSLKEITAYKVVLTQSANVVYDRGLPSVLFEAGPSGGYSILNWKEIQ